MPEPSGVQPPSPLFDIVRRVRETPWPALVCGHRGDSQNAPENTLAAFRQAIDGGAELIEFDVHCSADGDVVVIHDERVDRTTDGHGEVHRLATGALREFSAGAWFAPRYADERVPLLDEVLDLCRGRTVPLIEMKVKRKRSAQAGVAVAEALRRHGMTREAVVICRELARVEEVHEAAPEIPLCYLTFTKRQARGATRLPGVQGVDCYWKSLSLSLVQYMRAAKFFLTPWTVNRTQDMESLLLLGCETMITDCPLTLRDLVESFEFARAEELQEWWRRGGGKMDVDLEGDEPSGLEDDGDWPEDPPEDERGGAGPQE